MNAFSFANKNVLVTAGATIESFDFHQYLSNHSDGRLATALAGFMAHQGAFVTLVTAPVAVTVQHPRLKTIQVQSALEMDAVCCRFFEQADIVVMGADIPKYRPDRVENARRSQENAMYLKLVPNIDIAYEFGKVKHAGQFSVGFSFQDEHTSDPIKKMLHKNLNMSVTLPEVINQDKSSELSGFSILFSNYRTTSFPEMSFTEAARRIALEIAQSCREMEKSVPVREEINWNNRCA